MAADLHIHVFEDGQASAQEVTDFLKRHKGKRAFTISW